MELEQKHIIDLILTNYLPGMLFYFC